MGRKRKEDTELNNNLEQQVETVEMPVIIESMDAQQLNWNVGYFVDHMDNGLVNFDTPVQRGYVWNNKKDSLLIRSILRRIPISNFYFNKVEGVYEGLEGKQRGTAIYEFVKNKYKLHASTPPIMVNGQLFQIARHYFKTLPIQLQNRIASYAIDGHWFDDMSIDEKVEFFILTNSGKPVTAAEISRIRIKSRDIFLSLVEHPALLASISDISKRKCKDEDLLTQFWCLCFNDSDSLLQKDIGPALATTEVTQEQKVMLISALDYLSELYIKAKKEKNISKMKKPTHILSLAYMAFIANKRNISKEIYIDKAIAFFDGEGRAVTNNEEYNKSVGSGSAKPEQVRIRKAELEKALGTIPK